ncbi:hypothetical protein HDU98_004302 [Podochytrium sp. JEL0797]|nr:hypothetical protein HDU98_004302 [Podochytrium sp. JEL0797]
MRAASILAMSCTASAALVAVPYNLLWPRPHLFTSGSLNHTIDPSSLSFHFSGGNLALLSKAASRFQSNVLALGCKNQTVTSDITNVYVNITENDPTDLALADESFALDTTDSAVTIAAANSVGALRAFETLSQLVVPVSKLPFYATVDTPGCAKAAAAGFAPGFQIPAGPWHIQDRPNYSWRGVSLDTSRNFIPVQDIQRTLDGMAATKLNVLHWHIVDATAFPVESKTYPDLQNSAYDAFSVYSYDDVRQVIAFAADRGIRVVPEFDTPAHAYSWSASQALSHFVLCQNAAGGWTNPYNGGLGNQPDGSWYPLCVEPPCGAINIADPDAAPAVSKLLVEYATLFNDSVMHLGGDEVSSFCYATESKFLTRAFPGMSSYASVFPNATTSTTFPTGWYKGFTPVYQQYADHIISAVKATKQTTMHWEDIVINDGVVLPNGTIIQIWNGWDNKAAKNSLQKVLDLNKYQIVDSNNENYYLDCGSGKWLTDSIGYGNASWKEEYWCAYRNWQHIYNHDPRTSPMQNTTDTAGTGLAAVPKGNLKLILGAEAAIWGETIDASNLDTKLWPRAAALAEALWSSFDDAANKDMFEAEPRLSVMRDRLISRGMRAEAIHPAWCNSHLCGFSFKGNTSPFGNAQKVTGSKDLAAGACLNHGAHFLMIGALVVMLL